MIFVQIAAYRDSELLPTILDCLEKATYPGDLRFGICWQRAEDDHSLDPFEGDVRFRIENYHWRESQGLGWARSRIQKLYEGEQYTLQIDSHHRFAKGWDSALIDMLELTGSPKPIVGSYAGVYDPSRDEQVAGAPHKMVGSGFTPSGTISFWPRPIDGWQELAKPVRARFVSGHYFFTLGGHCEEYRYDPLLYFGGDEISLSIRSFTLGYDLFHPHRTLIWHEYIRAKSPKHWSDHVDEIPELKKPKWATLEFQSKRRIRKLLREDDNDERLEGFDLGEVRSHADYELYAGIHFASRSLHETTLQGIEPPCVEAAVPGWFQRSRKAFRVSKAWHPQSFAQCDDLKFIYFGVEDSSGNVLHREDAPPEVLHSSERSEVATFDFHSQNPPAKLVIWPYSRSDGWLQREDLTITSQDFTNIP